MQHNLYGHKYYFLQSFSSTPIYHIYGIKYKHFSSYDFYKDHTLWNPTAEE